MHDMPPWAVCQNFRDSLPRESLSRCEARSRVRGSVAVLLFLIAWLGGSSVLSTTCQITDGNELQAELCRFAKRTTT